MKKITVCLLMCCILLPLFTVFAVADSAFFNTYGITGIDIDRGSNFIVIYTEGDSAPTEGIGYEVAVDAEGKVVEVGGNNATAIPEGGFVVSATGSKKNFINKLEVGDYAAYSSDDSTVTVMSSDYSPFSSETLSFTAYNASRAQDTLIIYNRGTTTNTNTWGYEVCVDSNGIIISVGGNNNAIPEGGFVLSAVGTPKQPLTDAAELGMHVSIDDSTKKVTISYTEENALAGFRMKLEQLEMNIEASQRGFALLDYDKLGRIKNYLTERCKAIASALDGGNVFRFIIEGDAFDTAYEIALSELIEYSCVEGRALWLRIPEKSGEASVKSVAKQVYESGFNIVCIEILFDNTTIMPVPEGSLLEQNPVFAGTDMLKLYIDEFHRYGIEVHAWMTCYRIGYEGSSNTSRSVGYKKPEWRNISQNGNSTVSNEYGDAFFLNPALPEVKEFLLDTYEYILTNYDIDGFQLDYVRYPENSTENFGYDEYTKSLFISEYGEGVIPTASNQARWKEWYTFRASFVTDLVKSVGEMIDELRPDIIFSCDVAPSYSESIYKMCQDSVKWMEEGYVDAIFPMAYGTTDVVKKWTASTQESCDDVFTYIGLRDNGAEVYRDQIVALRAMNADGNAFFSYSQYFAGDYKGYIDTSVYGYDAVSPTYDSSLAVRTLLGYASELIDLKIVPAFIEKGVDTEVSDAYGAVSQKAKELEELLGTKTLTECAEGIDELILLINSASAFSEDTEDYSALNTAGEKLIALSAKLQKIVRNSKDDEKAEYRASHPLPELYELSAREPAGDMFDETPVGGGSGNTDNSDESVPGLDVVETTAFEKVFQVLSVMIMFVSIIGLPYFFYIKSRQKKEKDASKDTAPDEGQDDSEILLPEEAEDDSDSKE